MANRFTETGKWNDGWFLNLKPLEKLLFNYLCDNCNAAGIIEIIIPRWINDLRGSGHLTSKEIEGALKGLERSFIYSKEKDCLYLKTFLKHQRNLPLNPNNPAHKGILARFADYAHKFDIEDINIFIEGASKGLQSPIGNGNSNSNGIMVGAGRKSINEDWPSEINLPFGEKFHHTWDEWVKFRVEIRKKLTPTAIHQQLADIQKWSEGNEVTACEIIKQSIRNGWQGLFELKLPINGKKQPEPAYKMYEGENLSLKR